MENEHIIQLEEFMFVKCKWAECHKYAIWNLGEMSNFHNSISLLFSVVQPGNFSDTSLTLMIISLFPVAIITRFGVLN